jgi:hypothetical protein
MRMVNSVHWSRGVAWFNMPPCQGGDRGFKSRRDRHYLLSWTTPRPGFLLSEIERKVCIFSFRLLLTNKRAVLLI